MSNNFFMRALDVTSKYTEIEKEKILSPCKEIEIVDARYLLIYILKREGYYYSQIAKFLHMTKPGVRYAFNTIGTRIENNKILKKILSDILKELNCNN